MPSRMQITLDPETQRRAKARAAELGISFAEYVRRLLARDLTGSMPEADRTVVFDLGRSAGGDIASDKDRLIADAIDADARRRAQ